MCGTSLRKSKHENESIARKASWHRTYPTCAALFCRCFGLRFLNRRLHDPRPRPDPHTQVGNWQRHLMTGAAKRVPSLRLRRAAAMAACGVSSTYAKICPACPRIIVTPGFHRIYIICLATAVVLGMRLEQARVTMPVASNLMIANADGPTSDCVLIALKKNPGG